MQRPNQGNMVQPPEPTGLRGTGYPSEGVQEKRIARWRFNPNMPAATQKLVSGIGQCHTPVNHLLGCWDVGAQCHEHCLEGNLSTTMIKWNKQRRRETGCHCRRNCRLSLASDCLNDAYRSYSFVLKETLSTYLLAQVS